MAMNINCEAGSVAGREVAEEEGTHSASAFAGVALGAPVDGSANVSGMRAYAGAGTARYGQVMDMGGFVRWLSGEEKAESGK